MFGSHLSIAGSMVSALDEAARLGLDTVQVFTKNQQQWQVRPLDPAVVRDWTARLDRLGWRGRVVSHASYLINLAAPADDLWRKSIDLMRVEIERCAELGIAFLVHHPGAYTTSTLDDGLARIATAYKQLFASTRGLPVVSCLEGTAGAGTTIGGDFDHVARLRTMIADATGEPTRVGFCLDSCHLHAAGYDMSTLASAGRVLDEFDARCGIANLKVWHLNDSKGTLGSHLDRHAHIGEGEVGRGVDAATLADSGFAAIVNHPAFAAVPKILETPKEEGKDPDSGRADTINVARLRALVSGTTEPSVVGLRTRLAPDAPKKPKEAKAKDKIKAKVAPLVAPRLSRAAGQQSRPASKAGRTTSKRAAAPGKARAKARKKA